ncbi:dynein heavy chain and region D6 of dynein motor-domain-containing protein [Pavlovales sp. CCMP2436]|nr:dynein heavy chain and region D6 of dynein motor-domain-containing protein [Pavlovales sp. CCMP2436]
MQDSLDSVGLRSPLESEHVRNAAINEAIVHTLWTGCSPGLQHRHRLLCAGLLAARILLLDQRMQPGEWRFFLAPPAPVLLDAPPPADVPWLEPHAWAEVCALEVLNVSETSPAAGASSTAQPAHRERPPVAPSATGLGSELVGGGAGEGEPLSRLDFPFIGLSAHLAAHPLLWEPILLADEGHVLPLPGGWEENLSALVKSIWFIKHAVVKQMLLELLIQLVAFELGAAIAAPSAPTLASGLKLAGGHEPITLLTAGNAEPVRELQRLCDWVRGPGRLRVVSLGQGQGSVAERAMRIGAEAGEWVLLQNCHLLPEWLPRLEAIALEQAREQEGALALQQAEAHEFAPLPKSASAAALGATDAPKAAALARTARARLAALAGAGGDPASKPPSSRSRGAVKSTYRLWMSTSVDGPFPAAVLERSFKLAYEPPHGVRTALRSTFGLLSQQWLRAHVTDARRLRAVYSLTLFHAMAVERAAFGPLGLSTRPGFDEADLDCALRQLERSLAGGCHGAGALHKLVAESTYGGRVHSAWDQRVLLATFECAALAPMLQAERAHASLAAAGLPAATGLADAELPPPPTPPPPPSPPPLLPALARLLPPLNVATVLGALEHLDGLPALDTTPEIFELHANATTARAERGGLALVTELGLLEPPFSLALNRGPEGVRRGAGFLAAGQLQAGLNARPRDVLVRSAEAAEDKLARLRALCADMLVGATLRSLQTGSLQAAVEAEAQLPLERLSFECQFGAPPRVLEAIRSSTGGGAWAPGFGAELAAGTASGDDDDASVLYVYGLFLEGARWDSARGCLAELEPRQMHAPLPVLGLRPVAGRRVPVAGIYVCPVYKTVSRVDAQTSSGHVIPNLVTSLELPTGDAPPTVGRGRPAQDALAHTIAPHWIRRGVAAFLSTPT